MILNFKGLSVRVSRLPWSFSNLGVESVTYPNRHAYYSDPTSRPVELTVASDGTFHRIPAVITEFGQLHW